MLSFFNPGAMPIVAVGSQKFSVRRPLPSTTYPPNLFRIINPSRAGASSAVSTTRSKSPRASWFGYSQATFGTSPSTSAPAPPTSVNGPDSTSHPQQKTNPSNFSGSRWASPTASSSSPTPPKSFTRRPTSTTRRESAPSSGTTPPLTSHGP